MLFVVALMAFLFPLAYSPGPGNMFFAALGARFGTVVTLPANAGYHIATLVVTGLLGLGLVSAVHPGTAFFVGLKLAGSVYVMWLAWKMATSRQPPTTGMQSGKAGFGLDGRLAASAQPQSLCHHLGRYRRGPSVPESSPVPDGTR
jgi:threonine/homoserine/homoserine lactone efflux protein